MLATMPIWYLVVALRLRRSVFDSTEHNSILSYISFVIRDVMTLGFPHQ